MFVCAVYVYALLISTCVHIVVVCVLSLCFIQFVFIGVIQVQVGKDQWNNV